MRIYYDTEEGRILHTMSGDNNLFPPGDYIEVPDGTVCSPMAAYKIEEGALVQHNDEPIKQRLRQKITKERDRRLEAGAVISVSGYGDIPVQGRDQDISIYTNLMLRAQAETSNMPFRDRDNVVHSLTPAQMVELLTQAAAAAEAIYAASWALKDADPIPEDYTEEGYWP